MTKKTFILRNHISFMIFASIIFLSVFSCREEKPKTETIIIEKQVEKPVEQPKAEDSDGTSININKEGVGFSSKNGKKKTEINIGD